MEGGVSTAKAAFANCPTKILIFAALMCIGLFIAQAAGTTPAVNERLSFMARLPCNIALSYIVIKVGLEFDVDRSNLSAYTKDYLVATLAAVCPTLLVFCYMLMMVGNPEVAFLGFGNQPTITTMQALLLSIFAGPTSAGMLLTLLGAANLKGTWIYMKASTLAIFDDLDSLVFIAVMKAVAMPGDGFRGAPLLLTLVLLAIAWVCTHQLDIPHSWPRLLLYASVIGVSLWLLEGVHRAYPDSKWLFDMAVLMPSFTLGCVIRHDPEESNAQQCQEETNDSLVSQYLSREQMDFVMGCTFMVCVGLSMPTFTGLQEMGTGTVIFHVVVINVLMLLGKFVIPFFYGSEADLRQRWGLAIAMCPRGEIGAAVIFITIQTAGDLIDSVFIAIATLSVIVNLVLSTGLIAYVVKVAKSDLRAGRGGYLQLLA